MGRNILFITTDQQRFDSLGCNGGQIARTPVADRLASQGVRYERALQTRTRCACRPARPCSPGSTCAPMGSSPNGIPLPEDAAAASPPTWPRPAGYRTAPAGEGPLPARFRPRPASGAGPPRRRQHDEGSVARLRPVRAGHARAPPSAKIRLSHYGRWLADNHPEHLHSFADLLPGGSPGGDTDVPETKNNPIPRCGTTPTGSPICVVDQLVELPRRRRLVRVDELPRPAPPPGAARLRARTVCPLAATPTCPPVIPGSPDEIRKVLAQKPAHWLGYYEGTWNNQGGRPGHLPAPEPDRRQHPRDQRQDPRHERADRRGLRPRASPPPGGHGVGWTRPT